MTEKKKFKFTQAVADLHAAKVQLEMAGAWDLVERVNKLIRETVEYEERKEAVHGQGKKS